MHIPNFVIHSFVGRNLDCFHLLLIVNNPAMNIGIKVYVGGPAFNYFEYIPTSRIAGSYGAVLRK